MQAVMEPIVPATELSQRAVRAGAVAGMYGTV